VLSTPPAFILSQDQTLQFELGFSVFRARARLRNPVRWNLVVADSPPSVKTAENLRTDVGLSLLFSFQRTGSPLLADSGRPEIRAADRSRRLRAASNLEARERTGAEIVASVRLAGRPEDIWMTQESRTGGSSMKLGVGSLVDTGARPAVGPDL
jgi:hypothetical protein